ncbi:MULTISPECIES: hypothetical protein [unclassified Prochlorococcus]|uniref:hypothetical protein n=1 Tax=unclassified Prochlorococcus TaxID=2627481 RepID=UPI00053382F5|nr:MULTISPECIES: hypothetical protein [unclassified Prochlorococcus]KGG16146.1 hypothetical protein EV06_0856 [Prochlorococcus sp. MIT 0602]KGG17265.1 hypothetical protein EV07_0703 [Prochlorococcus sp. MIT 0603]
MDKDAASSLAMSLILGYRKQMQATDSINEFLKIEEKEMDLKESLITWLQDEVKGCY